MVDIGLLFLRRLTRAGERLSRLSHAGLVRRGQRGSVHLLLVVALVLGVSLWGISEILQRKLDAETAIAEAGVTSLNDARGALLDYALSPSPKLEVENRAGSYAALIDGGAARPHRFFALPCPDVASEDSNLDGVSDILADDGTLQDCGEAATEQIPLRAGSRLGRLPWRTFSGGREGRLHYVRGAGGNIKDNNHDRFWYYVSRNVARADLALNPHWLLRQTDDWLSVGTQNGEVIPRIAAMVISPGAASGPRFSEQEAREGGLTAQDFATDAGRRTQAGRFLDFDGSSAEVTVNRPTQAQTDDEVQYLTIDELAASGGSGLERLAAADSQFMAMLEGRDGYLGVKQMMKAHFNRHGRMPAPASFGRGSAENRARPSGISGRTVVIGQRSFLMQDGAVNDIGTRTVTVLVPLRNLQYVYLQEGTRFSGATDNAEQLVGGAGLPPFNVQLYDLETDLNVTPMLGSVVAALTLGAYYPQDNLFGYRADRRAFDGFGETLTLESPAGDLTVTTFVPDASAPDAPADVRVFRSRFNPAATMALPVPRFQGGIVGSRINAALATPILGYLEGNNQARAVRTGGRAAAEESPQFGVQVRLPTGTRMQIDVIGDGITMELPDDLRMRRGGASFDPVSGTWRLERQLAAPVRIEANTDQVVSLALIVGDLPPKAGMAGFLPVDSHQAEFLPPEAEVILGTLANVLDYALEANGGSTVGVAQAVSNLPVEMEFFTNQRLAVIPFPPPGRPAAAPYRRPGTTTTITTNQGETRVTRERCNPGDVLRTECRAVAGGQGRLVSYLTSGGVRFGDPGSCDPGAGTRAVGGGGNPNALPLRGNANALPLRAVGGGNPNAVALRGANAGGGLLLPTNTPGVTERRGECIGGFRNVVQQRITGTLVMTLTTMAGALPALSADNINLPTPLFVNYLGATIARTTLFSLPAGTQIYYPPGATLAVGSDFAFPAGSRAFIPPRATMRVNILPESTLPGGRGTEGLQFTSGAPEREVYFENGAVMDLFGPSAARADVGTRIVLQDGKGVDSTQELFDIEVQTDYRTANADNARGGGMILQPLTGRRLEESVQPILLPSGSTLFAPRAQLRFLARPRNLALMTQGNLTNPVRLTATLTAMSTFIHSTTTTTTMTVLTFAVAEIETRTVTNTFEGARVQSRFKLGGEREIEPVLPSEIAPDPQWNLGWRYRGKADSGTKWVGGGVPQRCRTEGTIPQCLLEPGVANPRNKGTRHWEWQPRAPVATVTTVPCLCDHEDYRLSRPVCAPDPWTGVPDPAENIIEYGSEVVFNCLSFNDSYQIAESISVTMRQVTEEVLITNISQPLVSNVVLNRPVSLQLGAQAGSLFASGIGGVDGFEINEETHFILPSATNGGILLNRTTITSAAATLTAVSEITLPIRTILYDSSIPSLTPFAVNGRPGMAILDAPLVLTLAHPIEGRGIVLDQLMMVPQTDFRVGNNVIPADSVVDLTRGRAWPPGAVRTLPHVAEDMRAVSSEPMHMYFPAGVILTNAGDFTLLREYSVPGSGQAAREDVLEITIHRPIPLTMAWERHSSVYLSVDVTTAAAGASDSRGISEKGEVTIGASERLIMPPGSFIVIPPGATLDYLSPARHEGESLTATLTPAGADFANLPLNAVAVFPPGVTTSVETQYEGLVTLTTRLSLTLRVPTGERRVVGLTSAVVQQCLARPPLDRPVTVFADKRETVQLDVCLCDADVAGLPPELQRLDGFKWVGVVPEGECRAGADGRNNILVRDTSSAYSGLYPARDTILGNVPGINPRLTMSDVLLAGVLNLGGRDGSTFVTTVLTTRHYLRDHFKNQRCKVDGEFTKLPDSSILPTSQVVVAPQATATLGVSEQVTTTLVTVQTDRCECIDNTGVRSAGLVRRGDCSPNSANFLHKVLRDNPELDNPALDTDHCTGGHQLQTHLPRDPRNYELRVPATLTLLGLPTVVVTTRATAYAVERCDCRSTFRRNGLVRAGDCGAGNNFGFLGDELARTGADVGPGSIGGMVWDSNVCQGADPGSFHTVTLNPDDPVSITVHYPATVTLPGPYPDFKFVNPLSGRVLTAGVTNDYHLVTTIGGTERTITTPTYTVTNIVPAVPEQTTSRGFPALLGPCCSSGGELSSCADNSFSVNCLDGGDGKCDCAPGTTPDQAQVVRVASCPSGTNPINRGQISGSQAGQLACVSRRATPEIRTTLTLDTPTTPITDTPPPLVTMQRDLDIATELCRCDVDPAYLARINEGRVRNGRTPAPRFKYVGLVPAGDCRAGSDGSAGTGTDNVMLRASGWSGRLPATDTPLPSHFNSPDGTPTELALVLNLGGQDGSAFAHENSISFVSSGHPALAVGINRAGARCDPRGNFEPLPRSLDSTGLFGQQQRQSGPYNDVGVSVGVTNRIIETEACVCGGTGGLVRRGDCVAGGDFGFLFREYTRVHGTDNVAFIMSPGTQDVCAASGPDGPPTPPVAPQPTSFTIPFPILGPIPPPTVLPAESAATLAVFPRRVETESCQCSQFSGGLVRKGDCRPNGDYTWLYRQLQAASPDGQVDFALNPDQAQICERNGGPSSPPTTPTAPRPTSLNLPTPEGLALIKRLGGEDGKVYKDEACKTEFSPTDTIAPGATLNFRIKTAQTVTTAVTEPTFTTTVALSVATLVAPLTGTVPTSTATVTLENDIDDAALLTLFDPSDLDTLDTPLGRGLLCGRHPETCWRNKNGQGLFYDDLGRRTALPITAGTYTVFGKGVTHSREISGADATQNNPVPFPEGPVTITGLDICNCGGSGNIAFLAYRDQCGLEIPRQPPGLTNPCVGVNSNSIRTGRGARVTIQSRARAQTVTSQVRTGRGVETILTTLSAEDFVRLASERGLSSDNRYSLRIDIDVVTTTTENPGGTETRGGSVFLSNCCRGVNPGDGPECVSGFNPPRCDDGGDGVCNCGVDTISPPSSLGTTPTCPAGQGITGLSRIPWSVQCQAEPSTVIATATMRATVATPISANAPVGRVTECKYRRLDDQGRTVVFATVDMATKPEEFGCENTRSGYCSCDGVAEVFEPETVNTEQCECRTSARFGNILEAGLVREGQCRPSRTTDTEYNYLHNMLVKQDGSGGGALDLDHCGSDYFVNPHRPSDPRSLTFQRGTTMTLTRNGDPEVPTCRGAYDREISPIEPEYSYETVDPANPQPTPFHCHPTRPMTVTSYAEAATLTSIATMTLRGGAFTLGLSEFGPTYLRLGGNRGSGMAMVAHESMLTMSPIISYRGLTYLEQSERVGGELEPIDRHRAVIPPGTRGDIFGNVTGRDGLNFAAEMLPADTAEFLKNFPMVYAVAPQCRAEGGGGEIGGEDGLDCAEGAGEGLEFSAEMQERVVLEDELVAKGNILITAAVPEEPSVSDDVGLSVRIYARADFYNGDLTSPRVEGMSRAAYINARTGMPTFYSGQNGQVTLAEVEPTDVAVFSLLDGTPGGAEIRAYMLPLVNTLRITMQTSSTGNTLTMVRLDAMTNARIDNGREHYAVMGRGATVHAGGYTPGFATLAMGVVRVTTIRSTMTPLTTNLRIGPGAVVIGDRRRASGGIAGRDVFGRDSYIAWDGANIPLEDYLVVGPARYTMEVEPASRYASFDFAGNVLTVADVGERITSNERIALAGPPAAQGSSFRVMAGTQITMEQGYLWQGYISAKGGRAAATMHFSRAADLADSDGLDDRVYLRVQPQAELLNFWGSGQERLEGMDSRSIARSPGRVGIFDGAYFRRDQVSVITGGTQVSECRYVQRDAGGAAVRRLTVSLHVPYSFVIDGEVYGGRGADIACQNRTGEPWCRCAQPSSVPPYVEDFAEFPVCARQFHGREDIVWEGNSLHPAGTIDDGYTCVKIAQDFGGRRPPIYHQPTTASIGLDNFTPTDEIPDLRLFEDDVHYQRWQKTHLTELAATSALAPWATALTSNPPAPGSPIPPNEEVYVYAGQPPRLSGFRSPVVGDDSSVTIILELRDEDGNLVADEVSGLWSPRATELRDYDSAGRPKFPNRTQASVEVIPEVLASITMTQVAMLDTGGCRCEDRSGVPTAAGLILAGQCKAPPRNNGMFTLFSSPGAARPGLHPFAFNLDFCGGAYQPVPLSDVAGGTAPAQVAMTSFSFEQATMTVTLTTQVFVPAVPEIVITTTNTGKERYPVPGDRPIACLTVPGGDRTEVPYKLVYGAGAGIGQTQGEDADCQTTTPNTTPPTTAPLPPFAGQVVGLNPVLRAGFCGNNRLVDPATTMTMFTSVLGTVDYTCIISTTTVTMQMTMAEIPEETVTNRSPITLEAERRITRNLGLVPPFAVPGAVREGWLTWGFNNAPYAIPDQSYLDDGGEVWALRQMFNPYDLREESQPDDDARIAFRVGTTEATVRFNPPPFQMAGRRLAPHHAPSYPKFASVPPGISIRAYDGALAQPRKCIGTATSTTTVRITTEFRPLLQNCNCHSALPATADNRIEGAVIRGQCASSSAAITTNYAYNFAHLQKQRNAAFYAGTPLNLSQCAGVPDLAHSISGDPLPALAVAQGFLFVTTTMFIPSGNSPMPQRRVQGVLLGTAGDVERDNRGMGLNCEGGDIRSAAFSSRLRRNAVLATYADIDEPRIPDNREFSHNTYVATLVSNYETLALADTSEIYITAPTATVTASTIQRITMVTDYQCRDFTTAPLVGGGTTTTYSGTRHARCEPAANPSLNPAGNCADGSHHCVAEFTVTTTRRQVQTTATLFATLALVGDLRGGADGRITLSGHPRQLPNFGITLSERGVSLRRGEVLHYQYFLATATRRELDGGVLNRNVVDIPARDTGTLVLRNQLGSGTTTLAPIKLTVNQLPVRTVERVVMLTTELEYCECTLDRGAGGGDSGVTRKGECNADQYSNLYTRLGYRGAGAINPANQCRNQAGATATPRVFNARPNYYPFGFPSVYVTQATTRVPIGTIGEKTQRRLVGGGNERIVLPNPADARDIRTRIVPAEVSAPSGSNPNTFMQHSPGATDVVSTPPKNQTAPAPYRPYTVFLQPETPAAAVSAAMSRAFAAGETRTARLDSDMFIYLDRAYNTLAPVDNRAGDGGGGDYRPIPPQMFRFGDDFKIRGPAALVPHFGGKNRSAVAQTYAARSRFMHEVIGSDDLKLHEKYSEANFACSTELRGDGAAPENCPALYNPDNAPFWIPIISGIMALEGIEVSVEAPAAPAIVDPNAPSEDHLDLMFVLPQPSAVVQAEDGSRVTLYAGSILRPKDNTVIPAMRIPEAMQLQVNRVAYAAVDVSPVSPPTPVRMIRDEPFMRSWDFNYAPVRTTIGGEVRYVVPKRFGGHDVIDFRQVRGQRILTGFGGADNEPVYAYNAPPTGLPFWCDERDSWGCNPYNARAWAGGAGGRDSRLLNATRWRIDTPVTATLRYDGTLARGFLMNPRMATLFADYYSGANVWTGTHKFATYFPRRNYAPPYAQEGFTSFQEPDGNEVAPLGNPLSWHWLTRSPNGSFIPLGGARQFSARYEQARLARTEERSIYAAVPDAAGEYGCGGEENINVGYRLPGDFGEQFALFPDTPASGTGANKIAPPTPAVPSEAIAPDNPFAKLPCAGDAAHYWVGLRAQSDSTEFPNPLATLQTDTDEFVALRLAHRIVLTTELDVAPFSANGGYPTRPDSFFTFPQGAVAEILNVDAASWESVHPYAAKFLSGEILSNQGGFFPTRPQDIPLVIDRQPILSTTMRFFPEERDVLRATANVRCCGAENLAGTPFAACNPASYRTICDTGSDPICDCGTDSIRTESALAGGNCTALGAGLSLTMQTVPNVELEHACVSRRAGNYLVTITTGFTTLNVIEPAATIVAASASVTVSEGNTITTLIPSNTPTVEQVPQFLDLRVCSCNKPGSGVAAIGEVPDGECRAGGNDDALAGRANRLGVAQCTGGFRLWPDNTHGLGGRTQVGTLPVTLMVTVGNPNPVSRVRRYLAGLEEMEVQAVNDGWRRLDIGGRKVLHYARTESAPGDYARTNTPVRTNVWVRLPFGGQLVGATSTISLDPHAVVNPVLGTYLPGIPPVEEEEVPESPDKLISNYHAFASFADGQQTDIVRPALIIPKGKTVHIGETGGRIVNVKAAAFFSMTPLGNIECATGGIAGDTFFGDGTPGSGGVAANVRVINQAREGIAGGDSVFTAADGVFGLGHPCAWLDDRENTDGDRFFVYRSRRRYLEPYRTRVISNDRTFLLGGRLDLNVPGAVSTVLRTI